MNTEQINALAERVFHDQSMIADLGLTICVPRGRLVNIKAVAEKYLVNHEYEVAEDLTGNVRIVVLREPS